MVTDLRPRLPGTLHGLLDAGTRLYFTLQDSDDLLTETLAMLDHIERSIRAGQDVAPLLFEVYETVRLGTTGREKLWATLRHFAPKDSIWRLYT